MGLVVSELAAVASGRARRYGCRARIGTFVVARSTSPADRRGDEQGWTAPGGDHERCIGKRGPHGDGDPAGKVRERNTAQSHRTASKDDRVESRRPWAFFTALAGLIGLLLKVIPSRALGGFVESPEKAAEAGAMQAAEKNWGS